ncbi:MAG: hypothetical protein KF726_00930 [Anaerolineae bacterium]|nr:hypothetical protein [Anaerolineae bacterium]
MARTNPIAQRELNRLRQDRGKRRLPTLLGFTALGLVIVYFYSMLRDPESSVRSLAIYAVWIVNAVVAIRCIVAGVNVTAREFSAGTWDSLVLTGVGARRIFFGYWRASLKVSAPWMFALGVLRLAMLPIAMIGIVNLFAVDMVYLYGAPSPYNPTPFPPDMIFFDFLGNYALLAVFSAVALTMLEVLTCTALGIAAAALLRSSTLSILLATAIRLIPVFGGGVIAWLDGTVDFRSPFALFRHPATAIADLGTAPISRLVAPYMTWSLYSHADAASTLSIVYILIVILLLCSALSAYATIYYNGAQPSPHQMIHGFRKRLDLGQL